VVRGKPEIAVPLRCLSVSREGEARRVEERIGKERRGEAKRGGEGRGEERREKMRKGELQP